MRLESALKWVLLVLVSGAISTVGLEWLAGIAHGQQVGHTELTDFKAPLESYPPPNEHQAKTLLEGAKAEPKSEGWFLLTEVRLTTFNTNGTVQMLAEAPQCYFDSVQRTVTSSGPLRVKTADGNFFLEGEGFLLQQSNLQQTNMNLIISNRVHTIIRNTPIRPLKA